MVLKKTNLEMIQVQNSYFTYNKPLFLACGIELFLGIFRIQIYHLLIEIKNIIKFYENYVDDFFKSIARDKSDSEDDHKIVRLKIHLNFL